jgi:ADP-heptose:LPS heptosyltransferase
VIKLGALGDFIHAMHGFAAIRAHHAADHVTLLTTAPFAPLGRVAPWFDAVVTDARAPWWNLPAILRTVRLLRGFDFIYDLQTSRRSNRYFRLAARPPWSGIAPGCSHPHANPRRDLLHTIERQREQLAAAGIAHWPAPERDWLIGAGDRHGLSPQYALLIPGGAGVGGVKRWPVEHYAQAARHLASRGVTPVVIGGAAERSMGGVLRAACPAAIDLTTRTTLADIAALGAGAALVLGNDTGPVHLAASVGAPTIALFSAAGVPEQAAPRGPRGEWVRVLRRPRLADLPVGEVQAAIDATLAGDSSERRLQKA